MKYLRPLVFLLFICGFAISFRIGTSLGEARSDQAALWDGCIHTRFDIRPKPHAQYIVIDTMPGRDTTSNAPLQVIFIVRAQDFFDESLGGDSHPIAMGVIAIPRKPDYLVLPRDVVHLGGFNPFGAKSENSLTVTVTQFIQPTRRFLKLQGQLRHSNPLTAIRRP